MLLRLLGEVTVRVLFSTDWLFIVSLKNSCNEKLLKFDLTEVGEIKMRSGKEGTHSKGFPENIKHRFYQKLLFLLMFSDIIFYTFLELHSTLFEKRFSSRNFHFLTDLSQTPKPASQPKSTKHDKKLFFDLPFGCPTVSFGPLSTEQPH